MTLVGIHSDDDGNQIALILYSIMSAVGNWEYILRMGLL